MTTPATVVIVNPRSQSGALGKRWPEIAARIRRELPFEDVYTEAQGDATRLKAAISSHAAGVQRLDWR